MAGNPQIGSSAARIKLPSMPAAVTVALLATVFLFGLLATALLAIVALTDDSPGASRLGLLLTASDALPFILVLSLAPAVVFIWQNRSSLARRLMLIMLVQLVLAVILALLPLLLISKTIRTYFDDSANTGISLSANLSEGFLAQAQLQLEDTAVQLKARLAAVAGDSLALGIVLDELRVLYGLDVVAVLDGAGQPELVSPVAAVVEGVSPFFLQQLDAAQRVRTLRDVPGAPLTLVHVEPLRPGLADAPLAGLWLERALPANLSASIRKIEETTKNYRRSRALSGGISEALHTVVINAMLLLLFLSIYLSAYTGSRLGRRLGALASKMQQVAHMSAPSGGVPVAGADEITQVSRSFNEMVAKVGENVAREKRTRADLESIQEAIHAGLLVLDANLVIISRNSAAATLLGGELKEGASLGELARERPELEPFAAFFAGEERFPSGEVRLGARKLWVLTSPKGRGGASRIVMITDISEPLALEELRTRQEALSFTLHGIKNPLQPLLYYTESLDALTPKLDADGARLLERKREQMLHNINRINDQIDSMHKLVRRSPVRYAPVDVNAAVRETVRHLQLDGIELSFDLAADLAPMLYEREELVDAIENLVLNAKQQFAQVGRRHRVIGFGSRNRGPLVELSVEDNAGGVPPELLETIFKPHMSFKSGGHGIGLARIKKSAAAAGGSLSVANVTGRTGAGARFVLAVPRAQVLPGR